MDTSQRYDGIWRVLIVQDEMTFLRDQLKIFMARKDSDGQRMVMPLDFVLGEPISDLSTIQLGKDIQPTVIPRELAELLYAQLGYTLLNVDDPLKEIRRLRHENAETKKMLTSLIESIGRLGRATD
jgi:hypothetical protein